MRKIILSRALNYDGLGVQSQCRRKEPTIIRQLHKRLGTQRKVRVYVCAILTIGRYSIMVEDAETVPYPLSHCHVQGGIKRKGGVQLGCVRLDGSSLCH